MEAENWKQTLELLKAHNVDLIVSNGIMPNLDSLELLKIVRGSDAPIEISFLITTSKDEEQQVLGATQVGVTDYIIKPLAVQSFEKKIAKIMK